MTHLSLTILIGTAITSLAVPAFASTETVLMKSISFDPKTIEIKVGDAIEWKNVSYTPHSATANDGKAFDTGMIEPKKISKTIEFKTPGTFDYHCSMHGHAMSGQVIVKP